MRSWCRELTHLKRPWCWERLRAGGEGDDRGGDGWVASPTQRTWVWVNSGWWTGRPGMLQFMGSQRVGHNWATELNWTELNWIELIDGWRTWGRFYWVESELSCWEAIWELSLLEESGMGRAEEPKKGLREGRAKQSWVTSDTLPEDREILTLSSTFHCLFSPCPLHPSEKSLVNFIFYHISFFKKLKHSWFIIF